MNNTTLCWIPAKQDYITMATVKSGGGMILERELSDNVANSKALLLNNVSVIRFYIAVKTGVIYG